MTDGPMLGAFQLDRPVARGGMAEVWAGRHLATGLVVSIKVITGDRAQDPYFRQAFRHEIRAVAALDHPGVVRVLDHGQVGPEGAGVLPPDSPYLVMEHASGGSLREARRRVLVWPEIRTILLSLLGALGHAHARGLVHRDLKPGNVLVCGTGDPRPGLKLTDFGLARLMEDLDRPGSVEAVRGTLHYMAPEQCQGLFRDQGPWTDLYALGCIAYQLATGRPPFKGVRGEALMRAHVETAPPPLPPRRGLPEGYAAWIARLLAKSPWDRFQRAADAAWALSDLPEPEDMGPTRWIFPALATTQGLSDDLETDPTPRTPLPDDVRDDPVEPPTERAPAIIGGPLPPSQAHRSRGDVPPLPPSWREPQAPTPDLRLLDAGLGLFGLRPIALVGRDAERDRLWEALATVSREGTTRCVLLEGPSGTGISRLASWMGSRAHEVGGAHVLLLTHEPADPPLRPLRRMLARALGVTRLPREQTLARVRAFAGRHGLALSDADALVDLLRPRRGPQVDAPAARYALIRRLLACFASERPVLLRIEDLQWGGDAVGLVRSLLDARSEAQLPVLVVATARTGSGTALGEERIAALAGHARAETLSPGPLSPASMRRLVHGELRLSSPLALEVTSVSAGNPLFAVQLVGDWAQRGLLVPGDDGFELAEGATIELPDDLHAAWDRRVALTLAPLPPRTEVLLERAAVLGEQVEEREWSAACALDGDASVEATRAALVEALLEARLVRPTLRGVRFTHPMLRESLLRRAREAGRLADHHRRCADVLQALAGHADSAAWSGTRAERLGRHRYAAGQHRDALGPLLEAAEAWRRAGGHGECLALVALVQRILDEVGLPDEAPARRTVAHLRLVSHQRRGEYTEADTWARRAVALARALPVGPDRASLLLDAVRYAYHRADWDRAHDLMAEVREALPEVVDDDLLLKNAFAEGHLARGRGDLPTARHWLERAADLALLLDDRNARGSALRDLGVIAWMEGDVRAARASYERARAVLADGGGLKDLAAALNNLGECCRALGDLDGAERYYREAAAVFDRAGAAADAPYPDVNLGLVLVSTGRHREALGPLTRALDEILRQGNRPFEAAVRLLIAPCCAALGDWPGWARQLDRLDGLRDDTHLVEPEMARFIEAAADRALQARRTPEARRGLTLAAHLHGLVGDEQTAARVLAARDTLDAEPDPVPPSG